jgi:uncharacterized protein DUF87
MLALQRMLKEQPQGFDDWLKQRRPVCDIALFREAGLCGETEARSTSLQPERAVPVGSHTPAERQQRHASGSPEIEERAGQSSLPPENSSASAHHGDYVEESAATELSDSPSIPLGLRMVGGRLEKPRSLALNLLPRHTAILAGSGSGMTVLLRRILEEAALQGVPAIVLDTNNDLAGLAALGLKHPRSSTTQIATKHAAISSRWRP